MRNPNAVTQTVTTTSTDFILTFGYPNAKIAAREFPSVQNTYTLVSGCVVTLEGKNIVVTSHLWKEDK